VVELVETITGKMVAQAVVAVTAVELLELQHRLVLEQPHIMVLTQELSAAAAQQAELVAVELERLAAIVLVELVVQAELAEILIPVGFLLLV
jgi:hypothetical protein